MSLLHRPATAPLRWPAATPGATPGAAMRDLPVLTWLPVGALSGLLVVALLAPPVARAAALPLAVAGAALGVPHGAVDHLVPWWWSRTAPPASRLAAFTAAYAVVAALALAAFLLAPTPALLAFLVLSAVHFGRGEVVTCAERAGRRTPGATQDWSPTVAHGLVVVGLMLWARPAQTATLLRPLSPSLADAAAASRPAGLLAVAVLLAVALTGLLRRRRTLDAAELVLLAAVFAAAPPLAAFGLYFGLWHSLRHTGRLLDLAAARNPDAGRPQAARALARAAALPSAVALTAVVVLWLARDLAGLQAEVGVLLALTFPHAAVVAALDRRGAR